jgi:cytochrome c-type biogenesis protein CcmH/NrfG
MSQNTSQKPIQRILVILSGLAFAGSTVLGMVSLLTTDIQASKDTSKTAAASKDEQLKAQAQGYELVLQREPENQVALSGLVDTRLQMNDLQGAVEPMEKLVKLHPDRSDYLEGLAKVRILMKDAKGAVEPLEKLVKLHPDRSDYKTALAKVKQEADKGGKMGAR